MFRCDFWVALSQAYNLLAFVDSCATVWTRVGLLVSLGEFPLPRPRPPLPGGVLFPPLAPFVKPPPICLPLPSVGL